MRLTRHLLLFFAILALTIGCTKPNRSEEVKGLIYELQGMLFENPEKALARVDSAEQVCLISTDAANFLRSTLYAQMGKSRLAIFYGEQFKDHPELASEGFSYYSQVLWLCKELKRHGEWGKALQIADEVNEYLGKGDVEEQTTLGVKSRLLIFKGDCEKDMGHMEKAERYYLEGINLLIDSITSPKDYWVIDGLAIAVIETTEFYLVDLLATYPDDIETALSEYNRQVVSFWDEAMKQWVKNNYHDMSVIRTAALDAFGQNWKLFTDKLVAAYQSGDETVKQKINKVTEYIPRVCNSQPEFDLGDYYEGIHRIAPEVIDDAFYAELDESYKRTVVSKHNSEFLEKYGLIIDCSILVCTLGHYNCCNYEKDDNGDYQFSYFLTFYPDGSLYMLDHDTQTMKPNGTWGGTLESTYQQLAFDRATGWSRWLMINEQEPPYYSYADFNIDLPDLLNLK